MHPAEYDVALGRGATVTVLCALRVSRCGTPEPMAGHGQSLH